MNKQEPQGNTAASVVDLDRERVRRGRSTERWVSMATVLEHFEISRTTLWRWVNDPRYMRGGRNCPCRRLWNSPPRYQIEVIEAWCEDSETPGATA